MSIRESMKRKAARAVRSRSQGSVGADAQAELNQRETEEVKPIETPKDAAAAPMDADTRMNQTPPPGTDPNINFSTRPLNPESETYKALPEIETPKVEPVQTPRTITAAPLRNDEQMANMPYVAGSELDKTPKVETPSVQPLQTDRPMEQKTSAPIQQTIAEPTIGTSAADNNANSTETQPQSAEQTYSTEEEYKRLAAAGATTEELAEFLAIHPELSKDVIRLNREVEDELDVNKKADREKKERIERNLVGLANMVAAFGNLANAVGSRDGRSVPVDGSMTKTVSDRQDKEKAERLQKLDMYNKAKDKYNEYVRGMYKRIADRKDKEALMDKQIEGQIKVAQAKQDTPEKQMELHIKEQQLENAKIQNKINQGKLSAQELAATKAAYEIQNENLKLMAGIADKMYTINDGLTVPKSVITPSTVGGAWDIISKDENLKRAFESSLHDKLGGIDIDINGKKISISYTQMQAAIGYALNDPNFKYKAELEDYLKRLKDNAQDFNVGSFKNGNVANRQGADLADLISDSGTAQPSQSSDNVPSIYK